MYHSMTYILDNPIEGIIFETFSVLDHNQNEVQLGLGLVRVRVRPFRSLTTTRTGSPPLPT